MAAAIGRFKRDQAANHFPVTGAGEIEVGPYSKCGDDFGVCFGVSWGTHGYAGGTLGEHEIKLLVHCLQEKLDGMDEARRKFAMNRMMEHDDKSDVPVVVVKKGG